MEITAHGAYAFPLAVYETQLDRCALGFVDWHWHEELQLVRVARGVVKFRVDERRFTLSAGQGLFITGSPSRFAAELISLSRQKSIGRMRVIPLRSR